MTPCETKRSWVRLLPTFLKPGSTCCLLEKKYEDCGMWNVRKSKLVVQNEWSRSNTDNAVLPRQDIVVWSQPIILLNTTTTLTYSNHKSPLLILFPQIAPDEAEPQAFLKATRQLSLRAHPSLSRSRKLSIHFSSFAKSVTNSTTAPYF